MDVKGPETALNVARFLVEPYSAPVASFFALPVISSGLELSHMPVSGWTN